MNVKERRRDKSDKCVQNGLAATQVYMPHADMRCTTRSTNKEQDDDFSKKEVMTRARMACRRPPFSIGVAGREATNYEKKK